MSERPKNKRGDYRGEHDHKFDKPEAQAKAQAGRTEKSNTKLAVKKSVQAKVVNTRTKLVKPFISDYIGDKMIASDSNGKSWTTEFIDNLLDEAKNDPNSKAASYLANVIFNPNFLDQLDKRAETEQLRNLDFVKYRIRETLYKEQQEIFDHTFNKQVEEKITFNVSGRRTGKSELDARLLLADALYPGHHALYLNRTTRNALKQGYDTVEKVLQSLGIKYKGTRGDGIINIENGGDITFGGASNTVDIDVYRGFHYSLIVADEFPHYKCQRYLFNEVLYPATIDYADSRIVLTGTPPRTKNFSYSLWNNPKAHLQKYNYNYTVNPFIPNKEGLLERIAEEIGEEPDSSFMRREYLADMEAFDVEALVWPKYTTYLWDDKTEPTTFDKAYIGVDYGDTDYNGVVALLITKDKKGYVYKKTYKHNKDSVTSLCNSIVELYEELKNHYIFNKGITVITDNNEKMITRELRVTYKIPDVRTAFKYDKAFAIDQLREFLATEAIKINKQNAELITDLENTVYKRDDETDRIIRELDEDAYHGDLIMCLLYVSRQYAFEILGRREGNNEAKIVEIEPGFSYLEEPYDVGKLVDETWEVQQLD